MKRAFLLTVFAAYLSIIQGQTTNHWETAVFNNDIWKYFVGTSEPPANWRSLTFDETSWLKGPGGFGYGDSDDNTVIPQCTSVFLRISFNVTDTASIEKALLSMDYDDAFVAYLNDVEIARSGLVALHPAFNQIGTDHEAAMYSGGTPESFYIYKKLLMTCLLPGKNVLAIQVHNSSATSTDMSSNAYLSFGISNSSVYFRQVPSWFVAPFDFISSNLPVVVITTKPGETIKNEPKITADMRIIFNEGGKRNNLSDSGNVYTGKVGIEIRGKYSASLPQKPYGFETRDISGNNLDVSLLGMPAENDWVLLANYNDKTFLRNVLAFDIFHKMGNYSTRMKYCEVVVNNEYQGIYLLGEKIKQDSGRVNIAALKPADNSGNSLTGGYIIKTDYYTSTDSWLSNFAPLSRPSAKIYFVYHDPAAEDLTEPQKTYIQGFINSLETALYSPYYKTPYSGYKQYIDIYSFADYFILGEVTRNVDAYKKSRFFYKDKTSNGGLLHSGPSWDFDWAWRNLTENCIHMNQTDGSGWAYRILDCSPNPVPPSWEIRMVQDNEFASLVHDKYFELRRTILSQAQLYNTIDSVANLLNEAQSRHFQKWKILGIPAGTPESGTQPTSYKGEIVKFKTWIDTRLTWLDGNMIKPASQNDPSAKVNCRAFPNPASEYFYVESDKEIKNISLYNSMGVRLEEKSDIFDYLVQFNTARFAPGIYMVRIIFTGGEMSKLIVLIK